MKTGKVLLACLAVALGVVFMTTSGTGAAKAADTKTASAKPAVKPAEKPVKGKVVVLYYLHPTWRCSRCMAFEAYAEEALKTGFPKELKSGKVAWKSLNTDEPQNAHFANDYKLVTKSLIVSDTRAGKEKAWKNLDQIWTLVGDKAAYMKYVQDGVREALKAK